MVNQKCQREMDTGSDKGNTSVAESKSQPGSDGPGRCEIEICHWIFSVGVLFFILQSVLASPPVFYKPAPHPHAGDHPHFNRLTDDTLSQNDLKVLIVHPYYGLLCSIISIRKNFEMRMRQIYEQFPVEV